MSPDKFRKNKKNKFLFKTKWPIYYCRIKMRIWFSLILCKAYTFFKETFKKISFDLMKLLMIFVCSYQHCMISNTGNHIQVPRELPWLLFPASCTHNACSNALGLYSHASCRITVMNPKGIVLVDLKSSCLLSYLQNADCFAMLLVTMHVQDFAVLMLKSHCYILVSSVSLTSCKTKLGLS